MLLLPAKTPVARVSFCTYKGGPLSQGHSFVAIEPLDPYFKTGRLTLNQQEYIGRLAIGIAPQSQKACATRFQWLRSPSPLHLRNDSRYLTRNSIRAVSQTINDEQFNAGLLRINNAAQIFKQDFELQRSNTNQGTANTHLAKGIEKAPNSQHYSSCDGALYLYLGFTQELPKDITQYYYKGIAPKELWSKMQHPLSSLSQFQLPQPLDLTNLKQLLALREDLPVFLGQTSLLIQNMNADLHDLDAALTHVQNTLDTLIRTYEPFLTQFSDCAKQSSPALTRLSQKIPSVIQDIAKLLEISSNTPLVIDPAQVLTQVLLSQKGRTQVKTTITQAQECIRELNSVVLTFNQLTNNNSTAITPPASLEKDLRELTGALDQLSILGAQLPKRFNTYLDQLNRLILDVLKT